VSGHFIHRSSALRRLHTRYARGVVRKKYRSSPEQVPTSTQQIHPPLRSTSIFGPILAIRCGREDRCAAMRRMSSLCCEQHTRCGQHDCERQCTTVPRALAASPSCPGSTTPGGFGGSGAVLALVPHALQTIVFGNMRPARLALYERWLYQGSGGSLPPTLAIKTCRSVFGDLRCANCT
jgi:hypothetical protein